SILNLSGVSRHIYTKDIFPLGGTYEAYDADPLTYIANDSQVDHITGTLTSDSSSITLKPYSVTEISANTVPPPPPPKLQITAKSSTTFCDGSSVKLDAGVGYISYLWSTGETTRKITVTTGGDYWVKAWTVQNGYATGDTVTVVVNPLPKPPKINPS